MCLDGDYWIGLKSTEQLKHRLELEWMVRWRKGLRNDFQDLGSGGCMDDRVVTH